MKIQLLQGQFLAQDAIDIITQMINVKIKYHENKIAGAEGEEAIKMREQRIKKLQHDLQEVRRHILNQGASISMESAVQFS